MDHVAIMRKEWKLIEKILNGEKTIESRWYKTKRTPWNKITKGDTIYFKDAGCDITAKAQVKRVLQFAEYTKKELQDILERYAKQIAFVDPDVFEWARKRKYCILIFLENPREIRPFPIDKTGFGNACAWIRVENINVIKR